MIEILKIYFGKSNVLNKIFRKNVLHEIVRCNCTKIPLHHRNKEIMRLLEAMNYFNSFLQKVRLAVRLL